MVTQPSFTPPAPPPGPPPYQGPAGLPEAPPPRPSLFDPWLDLIWVRLPVALRRLGALPALAAADGMHLSAVPPLGAALPPFALILGLLCGAVRFATEWSFSESLGVMALFAFVAFFGGAGSGLWMWVGYVVGDFLLYPHPAIYYRDWNPIEGFVRVRGAWLLLYVLLALLLVVMPLTASALRRVTPLPFPRPSLAATIAEGVLYAAVGLLLVYSWTQSVPLLQRPIFTWRGDTPTVASMYPLQNYAYWVVLAAFLGAGARTALEALTWDSTALRARQARFGAALAAAARRVGWTRVPWPARLAVGALFTTILLSGMFPGWGDGIALLVLLILIYLARQFLSNLVPQWYHLASKVPLIARLLLAVLLSWFLTRLVLGVLWPSNYIASALLRRLLEPLRDGTSFRPIMLTTLVGLLIATVLTPPPPETRPARAVPPAAPPQPPPYTGQTPTQPLEVQR